MQMWPRYIYTYISRPSATFDASRRLFISSVKFIAVKFSALSSLRPGLYAEPINGNGRCSVDRGEWGVGPEGAFAENIIAGQD